MAKFMTTKEASEKWVIPADTVKPADKRLKGDGGILPSEKKVAAKSGKKLPLPIGISDYRKASGEYYYVDKTLLIRDFIDERPLASLFTRPRRFGKTLNMDMLRVFFERTEEDTSVYFRDKKIWTWRQLLLLMNMIRRFSRDMFVDIMIKLLIL